MMPPSIPRPSLRAFQSTTIRSFSTTPSRSTTKIPPESPRYINLSQPAQSVERRRPFLKGHLPVPREVFAPLDGNHKVTRDYLQKTAPLSASEAAGEAPATEFEIRRREAAASRRENLTAGLRGLHARSERRRSRAQKARTEKLERNRIAAIETPERADVVLTRPSVRRDTALNTAVLPDPNRMEHAAISASNYAARQQLRSDNRRGALVEMYVASKDFIIDEAELRAKVDKVFADDALTSKGHNYMGQDNETVENASTWTVYGKQMNVSDMARETTAGDSGLHTNALIMAARRQRKLMEVLTGGRLPVD